MKYLIFKTPAGPRLGALRPDNRVVDLAAAYAAHLTGRGVFAAERLAAAVLPADLVACLENGEVAAAAARAAMAQAEAHPDGLVQAFAGLALAAPIRPHKIIGVRRNYVLHAEEAKLKTSEEPRMFFKLPQAIIGPGEAIERHFTQKLDYEAELVVIIGRKGKSIPRERALGWVAGYTLGNDVSARELQLDWTPAQTSLAKSFDTHAPIGPWIATPDEFAAAPPSLTIKCWVNGELRQSASTDTLLFDVPLMVSYLSQFITLNPGDAIYTGTPAGVGAFSDPPGYIGPGDVVKVAAEGLGELVNPVIAAPTA